jgi:hypothetical protein
MGGVVACSTGSHHACYSSFLALVSSPWSNQYFPPMDDGFLPNQRLRAMEIEANKIFDIYRKQYVLRHTIGVEACHRSTIAQRM